MHFLIDICKITNELFYIVLNKTYIAIAKKNEIDEKYELYILNLLRYNKLKDI